MPMHSRRPPTPPAPAFRIAEPHAPGTPPDESAAEPLPPAPPPRAREAEPPAPAARPAPDPRDARDAAAPPWRRSEAWAAVMLASFAVMLGAIVVPGLFKLVLIGLSALLGVAGVVMLARRGVFDHPSSHDG